MTNPDWLPIITTAYYDQLDVIQTLLVKQNDVNVKDGLGRTALFVASARGHREVVQALLDKGADPSQLRTEATANAAVSGGAIGMGIPGVYMPPQSICCAFNANPAIVLRGNSMGAINAGLMNGLGRR